MNIFIDVETFSSVDIKKSGVYPYTESPDFEIMLVGYAVDRGPIKTVDLTNNYPEDYELIEELLRGADTITAHNATFERLAFKKLGLTIPPENWTCTMIKAAYCGLPMSLDQAARVLNLTTQKDSAGKALIRYFCMPCNPTKANGGRTRNLPEHDPEKWEAFKSYLADDVGTCRDMFYALEPYKFTEQENYEIDQIINDRGVRLETDLIRHAVELDIVSRKALTEEARKLTGLSNPNSPTQLQSWLSDQLGENINDLKAGTVKTLLGSASGLGKRGLELRQMMSNTSVKKFTAAEKYACADGRARGLFQFYGAGRTGRWAGRGIQLQNMPRNYMPSLATARQLLLEGDTEALDFLYEDPQDVLKQLTRTMLAPKPNHKFLIADYSAIEARVLAWLAGEKWRLDVFNTHGKIYEASASKMFGVPLESVTKGSEYRQKGKISELALGYQGGVNALLSMDAEAMGLKEEELAPIVKMWRRANPAIVKYWSDIGAAAVLAMRNKGKNVKRCHVTFRYDGKVLLCFLPSGRPLIYQSPQLKPGKYGDQITYMGVDQYTRKWARLSTYGGKFTENVVQAVARDLLAFSMLNAERAGFPIVMHVHDEIVVEAEDYKANNAYENLINVITEKPDWAEGLPFAADGFIGDFYLKD